MKKLSVTGNVTNIANIEKNGIATAKTIFANILRNSLSCFNVHNGDFCGYP